MAKTMADLMDQALAKASKPIVVKSYTTKEVTETVTKKGKTKVITKTERVPVERTIVRKWNNVRIARVMQFVSNRRGLRNKYTEGYINSHVRFRMTHAARGAKKAATAAA